MKKSPLLLFLFMVLMNCQKDDGGAPIGTVRSGIISGEELTIEQAALLDKLPRATGLTPRNIILPNGQILDNYLGGLDPEFEDKWLRADPYSNLGPQAARNLLIKRLSAVALRLSDRGRMSNQYNQFNGLAYSWGSKDHARKQSPPGQGTVCKDPIHGLDCSGFIHQVFLNAGVPGLAGFRANDQRKPATLEKAIKAAIPALDKIKIDELGEISPAKFETGDLIYWFNGSDVFHIGIVIKDTDGNLAVFASNGTKGVTPEECQANLSATRGPTRIKLDNPYWFGSSVRYGVTRMNADISGDWEFKFRCEGQNNPDFVTHKLKFPTNISSTFTIPVSFIDNDGSNNKTVFEFKYDNSTNTLSASLITTDGSIPGFERKDSFSVKLEQDVIDYFLASLDYIKNGEGCKMEIHLKNLD